MWSSLTPASSRSPSPINVWDSSPFPKLPPWPESYHTLPSSYTAYYILGDGTCAHEAPRGLSLWIVWIFLIFTIPGPNEMLKLHICWMNIIVNEQAWLLVKFTIYFSLQTTELTGPHWVPFFFFNYYCCTKVLTIYHSWIHPLYHSPIPGWLSGNYLNEERGEPLRHLHRAGGASVSFATKACPQPVSFFLNT
jgi:hypothetical protein